MVINTKLLNSNDEDDKIVIDEDDKIVINSKILNKFKNKNDKRITIIQECKKHHKVFKLYIDPNKFRVEEIKGTYFRVKNTYT